MPARRAADRARCAIRSPGQVRHQRSNGPGCRRAWPARSRSRASPRAGRPGPSAGRPPRNVPAGRRPPAGSGPPRRRVPPYGSTRPAGVARPCAPGHRVDGEVAAGEVELDRAGELDPVRPPEVGVVVVAPERRDLVELPVAWHRHRPEAILVGGLGEDLQQPLRQRVGRQVPVGRRTAEQHVAQRAADHVAGLPRRPERLEELGDRTGDGVLDRRQLRPRKR